MQDCCSICDINVSLRRHPTSHTGGHCNRTRLAGAVDAEATYYSKFPDYTKRYQEIILDFPENVNRPDFELANVPDRDKTMRYMRAYFDLCFEEFYLNKEGLIDSKIWQVWRSGITFAFSKAAFGQA